MYLQPAFTSEQWLLERLDVCCRGAFRFLSTLNRILAHCAEEKIWKPLTRSKMVTASGAAFSTWCELSSNAVHARGSLALHSSIVFDLTSVIILRQQVSIDDREC